MLANTGCCGAGRPSVEQHVRHLLLQSHPPADACVLPGSGQHDVSDRASFVVEEMQALGCSLQSDLGANFGRYPLAMDDEASLASVQFDMNERDSARPFRVAWCLRARQATGAQVERRPMPP